eukprot:6632806-Pyramimonas_sp.AAC.1
MHGAARERASRYSRTRWRHNSPPLRRCRCRFLHVPIGLRSRLDRRGRTCPLALRLAFLACKPCCHDASHVNWKVGLTKSPGLGELGTRRSCQSLIAKNSSG